MHVGCLLSKEIIFCELAAAAASMSGSCTGISSGESGGVAVTSVVSEIIIFVSQRIVDQRKKMVIYLYRSKNAVSSCFVHDETSASKSPMVSAVQHPIW